MDKHRFCVSHLLPEASSFPGAQWGRLPHTCKLNPPVPSALATLPLMLLAVFPQNSPCARRGTSAREGQFSLCGFPDGFTCPPPPQAAHPSPGKFRRRKAN